MMNNKKWLIWASFGLVALIVLLVLILRNKRTYANGPSESFLASLGKTDHPVNPGSLFNCGRILQYGVWDSTEVEELQRYINTKLERKDWLTVDGDFGELTETALQEMFEGLYNEPGVKSIRLHDLPNYECQ
ncbi:MAG: hypothetical protein AAFR66_17910 [Bacteroidota bacterium]